MLAWNCLAGHAESRSAFIAARNPLAHGHDVPPDSDVPPRRPADSQGRPRGCRQAAKRATTKKVSHDVARAGRMPQVSITDRALRPFCPAHKPPPCRPAADGCYPQLLLLRVWRHGEHTGGRCVDVARQAAPCCVRRCCPPMRRFLDTARRSIALHWRCGRAGVRHRSNSSSGRVQSSTVAVHA